MNAKLRGFFLVGVMVLIGGCDSDNERATLESEEETNSFAAARVQRPAKTLGDEPYAEGAVAVPRYIAGPEDYLCVRGACTEQPAFTAETIQEGKWLLSHGYPSRRQLQEWGGLSTDQLKRVANSGSLAGMAVYGERLAAQGQFWTGMGALKNAADRGSIYAYYAISRAYAGNSPKRNRIDAAAYIRVAYILGDSKASEYMYRNFKLSPVEANVVDRRAAGLYATFAENARPSPRPQ